MNKKHLAAGIAVVAAGILLYLVGLQILPETIGLQVKLDGSLGNRVNKYLGLLLPLVLTGYAGYTYAVSGKRGQLVFGGLGILIYLLTFWINLR